MKTRTFLALFLALTCGCSATRIATRPPVRKLDIQRLLSDAEQVCIPLGTYVLPKALEVTRDNTTIWCEPGTRILVTNVNENVINIHGVKNIRIENAHLSHLKPLGEYNCHGSVINIKNAEGITIFNCDLNGCGAIGVRAQGSKDLLIQNCWIRKNTFNAVYLQSCSEVRLLTNLIEDNANFLQMYNTTDFEACDNLVRNNGGYWKERDPHPGMRTK